MCGICGEIRWGSESPVSLPFLQSMNRCLTHRGPDDEGYFTAAYEKNSVGGACSVGLGMRRLAIIDLSGGHQPMENESGDVTVVYNGETYNFQALRSELEARGHVFKTNADTEVLVHGYEVWGDEMPAKLNGMFAFAVWDKRRRRLLISRDRMGIKPLYYAALPNRLIFASEIKAILFDPAVPREIDGHAVDDYLSLRYIPQPLSIYKSIRKLDAGTSLIWENGTIRTRRFWNPVPAADQDKGLSYYLEKADAVLDDAVRRQLVADVPLGTFLSGGVDSPTISYYAKKHKPDLLTFNIYFADKSFSEREGATAVAKMLGTHHVEKEVTADIEDLIPKLVDVFDEPFGDDSMVPTYFLTKMARERMTVALSGDGGDELFGGYPTYLADRIAGYYRAIPSFLRKGVIEPMVQRLPVSFGPISFDYKAKAFVEAAHRASPLEHFGWTEIFRRGVKEELYSPGFAAATRDRPLAESYVNAFNDAGARRGLERFLFVDQRTHLMDEFLVKVDRLSMAHSLEVRPPFLDNEVVDLSLEVPIHYKVRGLTLKYLIRRLMKGRLPASITGGRKRGFSPPTARWLAEDLQAHVRRKFDPARLKDNPFLNPQAPLRLYEMHLNRKTNLGRRLWTLLMFVEWYDRKVLNRD